MEISQNFVAFSEYMNFTTYIGSHFYKTQHEHCIEWLVFHAKTKVCHLYQEIFSSHNWVKLILDQYSQQIYFLLLPKLHIFATGYSFWDRLRNFLHKFTSIVFSVHKLNKLGKFWWIYGQLLNIMSNHGGYGNILQWSHNY